MKREEESLQITFVDWFKMNYPDREIIHIPNGGSRNIIEAAKLKRMGTRKGALDLFFPEPMGSIPGLWIELKAPGKKKSKEQSEFAKKMYERRYIVQTCDRFEDCVSVAKQYFGKGKFQ